MFVSLFIIVKVIEVVLVAVKRVLIWIRSVSQEVFDEVTKCCRYSWIGKQVRANSFEVAVLIILELIVRLDLNRFR